MPSQASKTKYIYIYNNQEENDQQQTEYIYIKQILQSNRGFNDFKILKFTILTYKINKYIYIYIYIRKPIFSEIQISQIHFTS